MNKKKIVVIDDSALVLQIAGSIITKAGFEVSTAATFREASYHIFAAPVPSLILIDVEMPLFNGDKLTTILKEMEAVKNIPILLMSHKSDDLMKDLCDASRADGFIVKPLTPDKFEKVINQYCS